MATADPQYAETPDLPSMDPARYAQPDTPPQPKTGDDLAKLLKLVQSQQQGQQAPQGQDQLLQSLASQGMTRGLGGETPMGTPQLTFSGPVAGYAGPLRPGDVPFTNPNIRTMSPDQADAAQTGEEQVPGMPKGMTWGHLARLGQITKGMHPAVQGQIYEKLGIIPPGSSTLGTTGKPLGAGASKYINLETGEYAKPGQTAGEMASGDWATVDSGRGRIYENLNTLKNHITLTEKYLDAVPKGGWRWSNYAEMKARMLAGDPQATALGGQLEALTPLAVGRALSNAGARMGPQGAKYMAPAAFSLGDNQETLKEKLNNLKYLVYSTAKENGLPTGPFKDWEPAAAGAAEGAQGAQVGGMGGAAGGKKLDQGTAMQFLRQAGGDKAKARQLAKQAGYNF